MATIKPIEGSSVHQIQSGQVIIDLCSVVKELIENALDASASSLEIRFKNYGLDSIEVQDNGTGIAPDDFETIALKHYTSKLSSYNDLTSLTTFGFRGEALSSLCALSEFHVTTARPGDGSKGTRLDFETSGRLKARSVVAAQKGTTITVETIFRNLPVRRRELEKNIKREYAKVLGLLHAYACISVGVKFSVSNIPAKGKKVVVFSTKSNPTTRENIANVYGAKTLLALIALDLKLELHPTTASTQGTRNWETGESNEVKEVRLAGHISRPTVGEGRQTPDRQMLFVNSRPCALPQFSKAINEVYKSYNVTQSPFIFANLQLDTSAYDVNVSPDKRTILLHDQTALLEALKESLAELFQSHDQSVPQAATPSIRRLPSFKSLTVTKPLPTLEGPEDENDEAKSSSSGTNAGAPPASTIRRFVEQNTEDRDDVRQAPFASALAKQRRELASAAKELQMNATEKDSPISDSSSTAGAHAAQPVAVNDVNQGMPPEGERSLPRPVQDFNARMGVTMPLIDQSRRHLMVSDDEAEPDEEQMLEKGPQATPEEGIPSVSNTPQRLSPGPITSAFDRMRPKRMPQDIATITIGNQTMVATLGTPEAKKRRIHTPKFSLLGKELSRPGPSFMGTLNAFAAPGTHATDDEDEDEIDEDEGDDIRTAIRPPAGFIKVSALTSDVTLATSDSALLEIDDEPDDEPPELSAFLASEDGSDDEYMEEAEKKAREEARIAKLIEAAEERAARPTSNSVKRAANALIGRTRKDSTLQLVQSVDLSIARLEKHLRSLDRARHHSSSTSDQEDIENDSEAAAGISTESTAEERLSLTVSKTDFANMRIIGQFNLGFILATRSSASSTTTNSASDELFIIDQHASDEKFNFERLQSQTIVQNQPLVHPKTLDLTALEEEIILNHPSTLSKNGFQISIDESGDSPVGQRCKITSLPMSREVTFSLSDLEELVALLSENHGDNEQHVPRPSKVRRMFAMRACRSSIMVGKTLTKRQMEGVVRHMGELDKPWNCPHGRPTMRHLFSLGGWEPWEEGEGLCGLEEGKKGESDKETDWMRYIETVREYGLLDDGGDERRSGR